MIDPSIALGIRPGPSAAALVSEQQQKSQSLANLALQNQAAQLANQQQQQAMDDDKALRAIYREIYTAPAASPSPSPASAPPPVSNFDFVNATNTGTLPSAPVASPSAAAPVDPYEEIYRRAAGRVSPKTMQALQSAMLDHKTKLAAYTKEQLANESARSSMIQSKLSPAAQEADASKGKQLWDAATQDLLASQTITPQEAAAHPYPGSMQGAQSYVGGLNWHNSTLAAQQLATAAERKTQADIAGKKFDLEAPKLRADADAAQLQNLAGRLAAAPDQATYSAARAELPLKYAQVFPAQYDRAEILKRGLTPDQITTTEQAAANAAQTATRDANTARHEKVIEGIEASNARNNTIRTGLEQNKVAFDQGAIVRTAHALATGDLTRLKDLANLRGDQRLQIYDLAKQENPSFNLAEVDRKIKMEDWLANGKGADNLQSFGTFLEHAGAASDAVNQIRLSNVPVINKPLAWWRQNMSGDPLYTTLIASLEPARQEAQTFLKNGHALHKEDLEAAHTILNDNASPAQIQAALKVMGHTTGARYTEMNQRYSKVSGHDIENPFSPEALTGAAKIGVKLASARPSAKPAATPSAAPRGAPRIGTVDSGYTFLGGDPSDKNNWKRSN